MKRKFTAEAVRSYAKYHGIEGGEVFCACDFSAVLTVKELFDLRTIDGRGIQIELPPPAPGPSTYAFSIERGGSSMFGYILSDLLGVAGKPYVDVIGTLFERGISRREIRNDELAHLWGRPGYVFGIFREYDPSLRPLLLHQNRKILLVRDPRDMLTSLFFAVGRSHRLPTTDGALKNELLELRRLASGATIDEFVHAPLVNGVLDRYVCYADIVRKDPNLRFFRYEDIIFDKVGWVRELARELRLDVHPDLIEAIAENQDHWPREEDPLAHVRQVMPGNFRRHLSDESQQYIEERFAEPMSVFGYR